MEMKGWALSFGVGAAVGAVAAMMLPKQCVARRAAEKAATAVENAATKANDALNTKLDQMWQ